MATARDIVTRALRRIGYLDAGNAAKSDDAASALATLNGMMHAWAGRGLTYTHTTLTINATFPLLDKHHEGVIAMLAVRLTDDFAPEALTPTLMTAAKDGWSTLCGQYFVVPKSSFDLPGSPPPETTA